MRVEAVPRTLADVAASGGSTVLFDLDRTLIPGSSLVTLARSLAVQGIVGRATLARGALANAVFTRRGASDATADHLRRRALAIMAGIERAPLLSVCDDVARHLVDAMYPGARWLLERHREAGDFCVVVSAAPQELVEAFVRSAELHRAVGTRAEVVDGCFTGRLSGDFCYGTGKLARLDEELGTIDRTRTAAYADSGSDVPLLQSADRPVAVNPDRTMARAARVGRWPVIRLLRH